eukprot:COSAG06_NODE_56_length_27627_cov_106.527136_10_plen_296_part_00
MVSPHPSASEPEPESGGPPVWEFDDSPNGWRRYGSDVVELIEAAVSAGSTEAEYRFGSWQYTVYWHDVTNMAQMNMATGMRRTVRRRPPLQQAQSSAQGAAATPMIMGVNATCVIYALAPAIVDNINAKFESHHHQSVLDETFQHYIVATLMGYSNDADGCCPADFDQSQIKVKDVEGRWYRVDISVRENNSMNARALAGEDTLDHGHEKFTNVIVYEDETRPVHGSSPASGHCIYLGGCDIVAQEWIGLSSWGNQDQHPRISMHQNVSIYDVRVTSCVLLKGSLGGMEKILWDL